MHGKDQGGGEGQPGTAEQRTEQEKNKHRVERVERDVARVHARGPKPVRRALSARLRMVTGRYSLVGGGLVGGAPVLVGEGAQQGRLAQHRGVAPHQHVIIEDELVPQGARAHQHRGQQHGDDGRRAGRQRAGSRQATHGAVVWALRTVTVLRWIGFTGL